MKPPDINEWFEREPRLRRIAGALAVAGALLFALSIVIQAGVGGDNLDTDAGLLTQYAEDGSTLVLGRVLYSLCMLCFIPALYVLFKAGQARAPDRVRGSMVAFAFIGPVLLAAQAPILAVGLKEAGEQFAEERPALEAEQKAQSGDAQSGQSQGQADGQNGGSGDAGDAGDTAQGGDTPTSDEVTTTPTEEGGTDTGAAGSEGTTTDAAEEGDEEGDDPVEQRAEDLVDDNGTVSFSRALLLPALLGMVTGMVFFNLWAMRTGLLTRFMASFGMALGVSLILLPFSQLVLIIWFLVLGLIMLGRWVKPLPPAWDAGRAIPWLRPGEEPPDQGGPGAGPPGGPDDPIEGSGRQMSGDPPELPTDIPDPGSPGGEPDGGSNGQQPPRKRKRR
ncbi:MAG: hypothetical protein FJW90_11435 [Actinobacteria bacterium]|nr:hypothetical protein [Actinomycetota bacterium]